MNKFICTSAAFDAASYEGAEAIVIFLCKECVPGLGKIALPEAVYATAKAFLDGKADACGAGELQELTILHDGKLQRVYIAGCGEGKECKPVEFRKSAGAVARALHRAKVTKATFTAPLLLNGKRAHYLQALMEGLYLGGYTFNTYKSAAKPCPDCSVRVCSAIENGAEVLEQARIMAEAVCYARDLVNTPGNRLVPHTLVDAAYDLARDLPLEVEALDESAMLDKGMNAILAVGQGSANKPYMITLKYNGAEDAPYTAFVGKGITFDSGGISIKPEAGMGEMKDDMSGAAAVLGAVKAIAQLKLKCNIIAVLACAENMPGGNAQRPGDIVRAANGKTIEVISTDAEGRMVLADAVWHACRMGAAKVIDIATLTGAVIIALGNETSGIVGNDDELVEKIKTAGKSAGESYWQLPSLPECKEALKSDVADLLNSAGRAGGCITGGLFIGEFVDKDIPWAHIDIGGTSTATKTEGHKVKGGTGFGTLTLIKLAGDL